MKPLAPPIDLYVGLLQARLRFWLKIPSATAMHARLEAEIADREGKGAASLRPNSNPIHHPTGVGSE